MSTTTTTSGSDTSHRVRSSALDPKMLLTSLPDAVRKLDPRVMVSSPVMFVVEVGAVFSSVSAVVHPSVFAWTIVVWLWLTVVFANLAEAVAEGRGKAQAATLRRAKSETAARRLTREGTEESVPATQLRLDDRVVVEAGEVIPGDGDVVEGVASVDESAITGESAPVIRESGGDRSSVTGGTKVLSDRIVVRITARPGESFIDRMIALVEGAARQKTPNEIALNILLASLTIVFLAATVTLQPFAIYSGADQSVVVLVALLVCLIPTTIGALLSAIGIAGMDRLVQHNVLAMSGRAVEAAGDVNTLLLDKTGTITLGNREAAEFLPVGGVDVADLADAAQLSSLADETPEGRSIVVLAKRQYDLRERTTGELADATFVPFTAQTRMSGVDLEGRQVRKGAAAAVIAWVHENGGEPTNDVGATVDAISTAGGTPLIVAELVAGGPARVLGVVNLKDVVKEGMRERFDEMRRMGIRTVMITGDNPLTAKAIADEAGVDDFLAEATPEDKIALIKKEQEGGRLVAMTGDGTNDAPALAQANVGVAMNTGTSAAKEAGNMVDLDSNPTKLIEIVEIGKQLLITRGALTTFSIANDVAKYFAIIPAMFAGVYGGLDRLNVMRLDSPESAILSAVIFNALIIIALIPLALRGVTYKPSSAASMLRRNLGIYGLGGIVAPFVFIKLLDLLVSRIPGIHERPPMNRLGQLGPAIRLLLVLTVLLGLAYPLAVTGIAQVVFANQAEGSFVKQDGKVVGSSLIGQSFTGDRSYFQSRPSAAGDGYYLLASSASNLALDNPDLVRLVKQRRAAAARLDGVAPADVPADALLASGSGLDPQISPAYAEEQVARVSASRGLSERQVQTLVDRNTKGRTMGVLGEPRVNVLQLNLALDGFADGQTRSMATRGRLRVYLGAAPGVGKTYAMLGEGHRRAERGTDVVVGFVESHGRAHTEEMLDGLELVPRHRLDHRGAGFEEMDLDAVLGRRPKVALVDVLAHTNVPGSRNEKRWQDVEELLAAGIDVITTVNIQHLESVNDVVEKITGVPQRETVPDAVVRAADQVELRDMAAEALRRRLAHGNVYAPEKIDAALSNYFRIGNLNALRELALLWTADRVDDALQLYREQHEISGTWETRERVVVALTGGPEGDTLIRRGARIAARSSGGDLLAVHVARSDGLTGSSQGALADQRRFESLGGSYHQVLGDDVAESLLQFARAENATQLVLGDSRRSRLGALLTGAGIGTSTIRESGDIDVHMVQHNRSGRGRLLPRSRGALSRRRKVRGFALAILLPPLLTLALIPERGSVNLVSDMLLFLLLTVVVALVGGLAPALIAAVSGALLLNYFFTPPLHTLSIRETNNALALFVFILVAMLVSSVVDLAARRTRQAARAAAEASTLANLAGSALGGEDALTSMLERVRETFGLTSVTLLERDGHAWQALASAGPPCARPDEAETEVPAGEGLTLALRGDLLKAEDQRLVGAFAAQVAMVLDRIRLGEAAAAAKPLAEANQMRTALLAAVGHDLRTPLAAAKASVSSLRSKDIELARGDRQELLSAADESLDKLAALVENLLDMSRLQAGAMSIELQPTAISEVAARALDDLGSEGHRVVVDVPDDLPSVLADPGLLERVLANLIGNALRFSPSDRPPLLTGSHLGDRVEIRVVDRGPGIPVDDRERVFLPFQRLGDTDNTAGVGLGLALARGLVEAMRGTLEPDETPGGGLTMVVSLGAAAAESAEPGRRERSAEVTRP